MSETKAATDKGIGFATLFTLLAIGGAAAMLAGGDIAGWGFAAAVAAGSIAIAATHLYW